MVTQEYSEAISETLEILSHTKKSDVDKIPKKFMKFLKENASTTYKNKFDGIKRIQDMKLNEKTIGILSIINKRYWCDEEQRKEFEKNLKDNEFKYQQDLRKKYNPDSIFKNENPMKSDLKVIIADDKDEKITKNLFNSIKNRLSKLSKIFL